MRELEIRTWVKQLGASFGAPRPLVDVGPLRECYARKAYTEMVGLMLKPMKLEDISLRVGYVKSGGPAQAPAWVETPRPMPAFGTPAFKQLKLTMYLRKTFVEESSFQALVMAKSHELSHIVLNSIGHPLNLVEPAVDLTAMYLGFRQAFITPNEFEFEESDTTTQIRPEVLNKLEQMFGRKIPIRTREGFQVRPRFGYLTFSERQFAAKLMGTTEPLGY